MLPISIENSIGGYTYKILIDRIIVDASNGNASLDAAIVISDPHSSNKIAFAAENIGINNTGLTDATSKMYLIGDAELKINNASRLIFHGDQDLTFIEWDCEGVRGGGIDATVDFCTEHLLPIDPNTNKPKTDGSSYSFRITKLFDKWLNFVLVIQDAEPFALTTLPEYIWTVDNIGLDLHDDKGVEDAGIGDYSVPPGFNSLFYDEGSKTFDPRWRGFVLEELSVTFPNTFNKGNSNLTAAGIQNLVIDNNGASGVAFIEGEILSYSTGNLDGWQFSVKDLNLLVLQNHLAGGGFGGQIGVPVLEDPLNYQAVIAGKNAFSFKVQPTKDVKVPMFIAEATIEESSYIKASYDGNEFTAQASLTGDLKFASFDTTILKTMKLPQLRFEGLKVSNKNPYLEAGNWGISGDISGASMSWNGFGISVDSIHMLRSTGVDSVRLGIDLGVAMIDSMLIAKGGFDVKGVFTVNNVGIQKWKYDGIRLRHFCIDGNIKEFMQVKGCVEFYDEHSEGNNGFGNGFRGGLDVKLKAIGDRSIWAVGQFGKVDNKKYFFIDLGMETKEIKLGPFDLNAIGGGVAKGMELTGVVEYGDFLDPFEIINSPLGTTLSGLQYTPVPENLFKVRLFTRFTMADNEQLINGVGEFIIGFEKGVLDNFEFIATANFMSPVDYEGLALNAVPEVMKNLVGDNDNVDNPFNGMERPSTGSAMNGYCRLKLSFQEPSFTGNFAVWLSAGIVHGAGANKELVWAEIKFNKDEWYLWMGTPQSPAGFKTSDSGIC